MAASKGSRSRFRPGGDDLERRCLLSYVGGTGAQVLGLATRPGSRSIVVSFDGPLNASQAQNPANYRVEGLSPGADPEIVSSPGAVIPVEAAIYDGVQNQVTLALAGPVPRGRFARVSINGSPASGVKDGNGNTIDGDFDDTISGDFYGLVGAGSSLRFRDSDGDQATIRISGRARIETDQGQAQFPAPLLPTSPPSVGQQGQAQFPAWFPTGHPTTRFRSDCFAERRSTLSESSSVCEHDSGRVSQ